MSRYWVALAYTWQLGDKYELPKLQNDIVRAYMHGLKHNTIWWPDTLQEVLTAVTADCPLKRLIIEDVVVMAQDQGRAWESVEGAVIAGGAFVQLLECLEAYYKEDSYPSHQYGEDEIETAKYFVPEGGDDIKESNRIHSSATVGATQT